VAASNAKLALFYDWFFFDAEKDSIMNIGNPGSSINTSLFYFLSAADLHGFAV